MEETGRAKWWRHPGPWAVAVVALSVGFSVGLGFGSLTGGRGTNAAEETALPSPTISVPPGDPPATTEIGGIMIGQDGKPGGEVPPGVVQVDVFVDYICPFCQRFDQQMGATLWQKSAAGEIALVIHPLGLLDNFSTTNYSSRAAGAAVTVAALAPDQFRAFDQLLWQNQPPENGPGLSDEELVDLAKEAEVPLDVVAVIPTMPYADWVAQKTQLVASVEGFQGTPLVTLSLPGGQMWQFDWSQTDLDQALANVKAGLPPAPAQDETVPEPVPEEMP